MEQQTQQDQTPRRAFLTTAGAALTSSIFTRDVKGANDRIAVAFIGMGGMGTTNLKYALAQPNAEVVAVCDVYQPRIEKAVAATNNKAKGIKDFREILADKSVDAVCIATPDHWHAYMTVEACKAGKDVYVEKPACVAVEEGRKMVQAARKYNRVVQMGTMQRSGAHFQKAIEMVSSGRLGKVTFCRTWTYRNQSDEGIGNPPDSDPPLGLDWDLWLGPAPKHAFNPNRFSFKFRYFWDYAGGRMTDWGVHLLDTVQWALNDVAPTAISTLGGNFYLKDDRETPDTLLATFEYPGFLATYEVRDCNAQSMFNKDWGILFFGTKGTLFIDREGFRVIPEKDSNLQPLEEKKSDDGYAQHWTNFLECIRTRQKPVSDIEIGHRSTTTCLLGNVSLRSKLRLDWDSRAETTLQPAARKYLSREYRKPWKLVV